MVNVIALLRLLRHISVEIREQTGYTTPSKESSTRPNPARCVSKQVSWTEFL